MYLGIGSNMVKGLKYWLKAANIIEGNDNNLTEFAKLLHKHDQYLDKLFSWYLIHYYLTTNKEDCPVAYEVFNANMSVFDKTSVTEYVYRRFLNEDSTVSRKYVEADLNTFLKSYVNEDTFANPEDNYICPLTRLKLLAADKNGYRKLRPAYASLSYLVVYYALLMQYQGKPFEIEESMAAEMSPIKLFNLDKYMYLQYLDDARKNGLITINRTAGLNTVYFEKTLSLEELFEEGIGGRKNV